MTKCGMMWFATRRHRFSRTINHRLASHKVVAPRIFSGTVRVKSSGGEDEGSILCDNRHFCIAAG